VLQHSSSAVKSVRMTLVSAILNSQALSTERCLITGNSPVHFSLL
jgi:hypothetical protein